MKHACLWNISEKEPYVMTIAGAGVASYGVFLIGDMQRFVQISRRASWPQFQVSDDTSIYFLWLLKYIVVGSLNHG